MKIAIKTSLLIILLSVFCSISAAHAADKSKTKSAKQNNAFIQQFSNYLPYNQESKAVLQNSFVILEIEIDGNGMLHVAQVNSSKPEAADFVVGKLNGIKIKETAPDERFIIKYYFK